MKLFRMKTLGAFGIGFLAGSRAGRGPWEKAQSTVGELKGKIDGGMGNTNGSTSSDGFQGQWSKDDPKMTEV